MSKRVAEDRLLTFFDKLTLDLDRQAGLSSLKSQAVTRQLDRMRKRARLDRPALKATALRDFLATNQAVKDFQFSIPDDIRSAASDFIRHALERCVKAMYPESLQECFSWQFIYDNWAFGPGASNGVRGYGTVEKMDKPMSCTKSAGPFVAQMRLGDPFFQCYDALDGSNGIETVEGSRIDFVVKNETAVRTIAIEPSGNMAFQLAGGRLIERALRGIGLDIQNQQPRNQRLARYGSIHGTLATLDLKSASDRILIDLVRSVWPREWFSFFMKFRSPEIEIPDGSTVELQMMSTMGNGFTFPLMTMTILALLYANRLCNHNGPFRHVDWSVTAVFGDDIIIPTDECESLIALLEMCGFLVNKDKSYMSGPFRESCGGDYYSGYDVTPVYVKSLAYPAEIYVAINQLLNWSSRHEVIVSCSLLYLIRLLKKVYLVPEWCQDTAGIRTAQCPTRYSYLRKIDHLEAYKGPFVSRLAVGGYITNGWCDANEVIRSYQTKGSNAAFVYAPRTEAVYYKTGEARLPSGYLDGWDPSYRSSRASAFVDVVLSMLL